MKKVVGSFFLGQIIILFLIFFRNNDFSLLSYINMSFSVGGIMLFTGLASYVFSTGFFDIFIITTKKIFTSNRRWDDVQSMRPPSELFSGSVTSLLGGGALILGVMAISLILFYL